MKTHVDRLQSSGIRRLGTPRGGFRYAYARGGGPPRQDLARIAALRLPPAWREVAISGSAGARVQAVGRDAAGRWQYVYHADHVRKRERTKYERLLCFGEALPKLRRAVTRDLRQRELTRERVLATMVRILASACFRPGSEVYASENGSYGLATLRRRHIEVKGDTLRFDFPGKSGKRQQRVLRDARVARVVRRLLLIPGEKVFRYVGPEGKPIALKRRDLNAYVKEHMGAGFTVKDFRTWNGTLLCACALAHEGADCETRAARRKAVAAALRATAEQLGNTAAVCRSAYVSPAVLTAFDRGSLIESHASLESLVAARGDGLHLAERALLRLLRGGGVRVGESRPALRAAA
jgi:DNA topoisomerase-1